MLGPLTQWHSNHITQDMNPLQQCSQNIPFQGHCLQLTHLVPLLVKQLPRKCSHLSTVMTRQLAGWPLIQLQSAQHDHRYTHLGKTRQHYTCFNKTYSARNTFAASVIMDTSQTVHVWWYVHSASPLTTLPLQPCTNHLLSTVSCYTALDPCILLLRWYHYFYYHC